jgi:hypothetical protein
MEGPVMNPGSIPPFGSLFGLHTLCDRRLGENEVINFNAGDHSVSVSMQYEEYVRVERPELGTFAKSLPAEQAVEQGNEAIFSLPPRRVGLEVMVDGTTYTCTGSEAPVSRLIDSGRFLQRADIEQLVFQDAAGRRLPAAGRLAPVALAYVAYLAATRQGAGSSLGTLGLLALSGPVTTIPLAVLRGTVTHA